MKETTDHAEIRAWAERNLGKPQIYDNPLAGADKVGIRIDFPGSSDDDFPTGPNGPRDVSWEQFFSVLDQLGLSFIYEDAQELPVKSQLYRFGRRLRVE